jgi:hypothetical protein
MITLGLVAKNESKYLKEWVLYHRLIGVDNFSIYLHNNTDNSSSILEDLGVNFKNVSSEFLGFEVKNKLYAELIEQANTEFVCCLDIDEFIVIPEHDDIKDFLSSSLFDGFGGIVLHQNIFGSNDHQDSPNGLVIDNYTKRHPDKFDFPKNYPNFQQPCDLFKIIKTIVRRKSLKKVLDSHEYLTHTPIVDENGQLYRKYTCNRPLSKIRLNHYFTKSLEDWTFKTNRPRFSNSPKYPNEWFDYFSSFNYEDDLISTKYSSKIKELL